MSALADTAAWMAERAADPHRADYRTKLRGPLARERQAWIDQGGIAP